MRKKSSSVTPELLVKRLERRQALKGLGVLAATPTLLSVGCSSETGPGNPIGTPGSGGLSPTGGSSPQNTGGTSTAVQGGTSSTGGSASGGASMQMNGGASAQGGSSAQGGTSSSSGGASGSSSGGAQTSGGTSTSGGNSSGGNASGGTSNGGQSSGGTSNGGQANGGASSGGQSTGGTGGGGSLTSPPWDNAPSCTASKTDGAGQGPFFIHEEEKSDDVSLFRQDIRGRYNESAAPGVEMQLHLRLLDASSSECNGTPLKDVDVYIWHTDPQGYYSGFGNPGDQKPDEPYAGVPGQNDLKNSMRFCRGIQTTDANGVVSFRSTFPGWYNGRDLHIHFVAFKKGSKSHGRVMYSKSNEPAWLFTTQFYFDPAFSKSVHEKYEPYKARTKLSAYEGAMKADEAGNSGLRAKASIANDVVTAQMQILIKP